MVKLTPMQVMAIRMALGREAAFLEMLAKSCQLETERTHYEKRTQRVVELLELIAPGTQVVIGK